MITRKLMGNSMYSRARIEAVEVRLAGYRKQGFKVGKRKYREEL